jgi:large subunit ribosomal protein L21
VKNAIIETGGLQFTVTEGETLEVPRLSGEVGGKVVFDRVLFAADGDAKHVGTPTLAEAKVEAEIVAHGRERKVQIYKHKKRTGYRRKTGHRQDFTRVKITGMIF